MQNADQKLSVQDSAQAGKTTGKEIRLHAILLPAKEDGFVSMNPETGIYSQGESEAEAVANLREAVALYLEECPEEFPREISFEKPAPLLAIPAKTR